MRGWTFPSSSARRACFFDFGDGRSGKSLCGKWLLLGADESRVEDRNHDSKDNCAVCKRKHAKIVSAAGAASGEKT